MLPRHHDPILAIATAPGRGAVGILRVSGKHLAHLVQTLFGRALPPREATYLPFSDAAGAVIDRGLALYFPAPHSFTGEDVLELQAHGGPVLLQLLLARCLEAAQHIGADGQPVLPALRLATAGEFSERAFLSGKIDLAQAEAIADLIDASTEAAVRSAARAINAGTLVGARPRAASRSVMASAGCFRRKRISARGHPSPHPSPPPASMGEVAYSLNL